MFFKRKGNCVYSGRQRGRERDEKESKCAVYTGQEKEKQPGLPDQCP